MLFQPTCSRGRDSRERGREPGREKSDGEPGGAENEARGFRHRLQCRRKGQRRHAEQLESPDQVDEPTVPLPTPVNV